MTLNILTQFNAKNWTAAADVPATWKIGPRSVDFITIHWWGTPVGQTFAGIVDWFCNPQSSVQTSAHFVISAPNVACIVNPDDAAWHAGSAEGNVHSVGLECDPRCSDDDYQKIAETVVYLWGIYGKVPVVPHNHWTQTTCPGDYRIDRIVAIANSLYAGGSAPAATTTPTTTAPQEDTLSAAEVAEIKKYIDLKTKAVTDYIGAMTWYGFTTGGEQHPGIGKVVEEEQRRSVADRNVLAKVAEDVAALKAAPGGGVSSSADVLAAIQALPEAIRSDLKAHL